MEPDVMPFYSSSPPPLGDDEEDGEMGLGEEEFGDFSVVKSCSSIGIVDTIDPPSSFPASPPTTKPAAHHPSRSFNQPVEQFRPATTVNSEYSRGQMDSDRQESNADSSLHLTNGYTEGKHDSMVPSAVDPQEETGFADFTVFTEQTAHPWCCGFSPMSTPEQWDSKLGGTINSLAEQICDSEQEVVMKSEPRSHCGHKNKQNACIEMKDCQCGEEATVRLSLDRHQPQDAAAALESPSAEDLSGASQRDTKCRFNSLQTSEEHEDGDYSFSSIPPAFGLNEVASEDLPSFSEDFSFEGASADLEPNVSSLGSQDGATDWDGTDDEEDELENYTRFDSQKGFHLSALHATQETSSTSTQPHPDTHPEEQFADFAESSSELHGDREQPWPADGGVLSLGNLPPSDSFADFCSAPTREDEEGTWEFRDQSAELEGTTWAQFRKPFSSLQTDGNIEEEQDRGREGGGSRRNSSQVSLSCRVQQLLQTSFPEVPVPDSEEEVDLISLAALLQSQCLPESEEVKPELSSARWILQNLLSGHEDVHLAVGLQFQWSGSHVNRTLLSCLGVDTRNIVFMGTRKKPVTVPAFASGLGLLEPTKDSVPAVCSPGHTPDLSTHPVQEELPSSTRDWSSRGLSSSQDDGPAFNLDYFGLEEESRSNSSRSLSPPIGVDPELYELSMSKLDPSTDIHHLEDTLNHLMSTAERTSFSLKNLQPVENLSEEADDVICGLPNLSFMQAKVLMFPSILVPKGSLELN